MGAITDVSDHNLRNAKDFKEFMAMNQENMLTMTFSEYLTSLLYRKADKRPTRADVVRDSGLEKAYVYQIFNGQKKPSRDKLIALAFGLKLNDEETQRMLKLGGCSELYARTERDSLILFNICHGKSIYETDKTLYEWGLDTLLPQDD